MRHSLIAIAAAALAFIPTAYAAVQTVEADNGAVYRIIQTRYYSDNGTAVALVSTPDVEQTSFLFDCQGRRMAIGNSMLMRSIPPRSVAGRIADIACAKH
jgi:hypothetical protein